MCFKINVFKVRACDDRVPSTKYCRVSDTRPNRVTEPSIGSALVLSPCVTFNFKAHRPLAQYEQMITSYYRSRINSTAAMQVAHHVIHLILPKPLPSKGVVNFTGSTGFQLGPSEPQASVLPNTLLTHPLIIHLPNIYVAPLQGIYSEAFSLIVGNIISSICQIQLTLPIPCAWASMLFDSFIVCHISATGCGFASFSLTRSKSSAFAGRELRSFQFCSSSMTRSSSR